jgi:hypothetical protein
MLVSQRGRLIHKMGTDGLGGVRRASPPLECAGSRELFEAKADTDDPDDRAGSPFRDC